MFTVITVLQVIAAIMVVGFILLQPAKNSGSAFGPSEQSLTGNSAGTSAPFKLTMMAAAFIALSSLFLSWYHINSSKTSVVDELSEISINPDMAPSVPPAAETLPPQNEGNPAE
ncbi:preprotein translocase subunit SecG [bacterium]|nr:preprotein translocase subunit SecG [bacterium]